MRDDRVQCPECGFEVSDETECSLCGYSFDDDGVLGSLSGLFRN